MWEHIDGLHGENLVHVVEECQVARLCRGVAAHIYHTLGCCALDDLQYALVDTCTRWVEDDDIGAAVACDKLIAHNILHVAGVEHRILDAVNLGVYLCILNSLGNILHADNLRSAACAEVCDGTRACVEVVEDIRRLKVGEVARNLVELVCLLRVCLVERLGSHLELESLHLLDDVVLARKADGLAVAE